jgi:uncharacterized protein
MPRACGESTRRGIVLSLRSVFRRSARCILGAAISVGVVSGALADLSTGVRAERDGDYVRARAEYLPAAKDGNAAAQNNLARLYRMGKGGPVDFERALYWFSQAASQGQVNAQTGLGDMYKHGNGVPRDDLRAVYWFRRAAVAGFLIGQYALGGMFEQGRGVPRDPIAAFAWYTIASRAQVDPKDAGLEQARARTLEARSMLEQRMTTADRVVAEDIADRWVVGSDLPPPRDRDVPRTAATTHAPPKADARPAKKPGAASPRTGTGTGFVVNDRGDVVTNSHVASHCARLSFVLNGAAPVDGRLVTDDPTNDLAVVHFALQDPQPATLSNAARETLGEDVMVFGYPLLGILSTAGNLTRGSISALNGIGDDARYMQISAPVQPGNSGGPVLDAKARVIGVVTYKLNALTAVKASGDLPQNVNFALKVEVLRLFLDSHEIQYVIDDSSPAEVPAGSVGDVMQKFTGIVICAG